MSIELLATANEWALRVSLIILCFLSFVLHMRTRRVTFLLMFIGLIVIISSILVSSISWRFLFQKNISPQSWEKLVIIYNLSSILGYMISLLGCILEVLESQKTLNRKKSERSG